MKNQLFIVYSAFILSAISECESLVFAGNHHYRASGITDDFLCHTPQKKFLESGSTVRAENDQIDAFLFGILYDSMTQGVIMTNAKLSSSF